MADSGRGVRPRRWDGGVVLVSHDFRLIGQVANEIWECRDQNVHRWVRNPNRTRHHSRTALHAALLLCSLIVLWPWHIRCALSHAFSSAVVLCLCGCCDACLQPAVYQQPFPPPRALPLLLWPL